MKRSVVLGVVVLGLAVAFAIVARRLGWLEPARIGAAAVRLRRGHDPSVTAPLFVLALAGATAFGAPGTPFMLAAGVLFGVALGGLLSVTGVLLGGVAGYSVARVVGRGPVDRLVRRHHHVERLLRERGFWTMLRIRLLPVVPLGVGNFLAGLARMPLGPFLAATVLGVLPFAYLYAYLASSLLWGAEATKTRLLLNVTLASVALVAVSYLPGLVRRRMRRERRKRPRAPNDPGPERRVAAAGAAAPGP